MQRWSGMLPRDAIVDLHQDFHGSAFLNLSLSELSGVTSVVSTRCLGGSFAKTSTFITDDRAVLSRFLMGATPRPLNSISMLLLRRFYLRRISVFYAVG